MYSFPRSFYKRQDRFLATIIHSHGITDVGPSPADLAGLFGSEVTGRINPLVFVVTPERKILVFRGQDTPQWGETTVRSKVTTWNNAVLRRINKFIHSWMDREAQSDINKRAQDAFLRDVCQTYDLKLYACKSEDNIAVYQPGGIYALGE